MTSHKNIEISTSLDSYIITISYDWFERNLNIDIRVHRTISVLSM